MGIEITNRTQAEVQRIEADIRDLGVCVIKEQQLKLLFADKECNSKLFVLLVSLAYVNANGALSFSPTTEMSALLRSLDQTKLRWTRRPQSLEVTNSAWCPPKR